MTTKTLFPLLPRPHHDHDDYYHSYSCCCCCFCFCFCFCFSCCCCCCCCCCFCGSCCFYCGRYLYQTPEAKSRSSAVQICKGPRHRTAQAPQCASLWTTHTDLGCRPARTPTPKTSKTLTLKSPKPEPCRGLELRVIFLCQHSGGGSKIKSCKAACMASFQNHGPFVGTLDKPSYKGDPHIPKKKR